MAERGSDTALVERWRGGDREAGEALFERYHRALARFFGSKTDADPVDLIQSTLLACVEGKTRLRDDAAFRRYLFTTAHNVLFGHYRRRHADMDRRTLEESSLSDLGITPTGVLDGKRQRRVLLEALRMIPLPLQIALELHYWEGFSASEIAEIQSAPAGTIKTRIRRARQLLEQKIAELAASPEELATTRAELDDWARAVRDRAGIT